MDFWSGNEAIVEGAISVGARFFAGYPITPASPIMERWAILAEKNKRLIFLQSEDEIAAVHQVIGAAIAGFPSFTATSGPGFSLMQEGLGLAFVYGAPIVVVDVQRSGPSTGRATRAGQGEILASRFGSHGDLLPFVFYPTSVEDCFNLTVTAFEIAWKHQLPVIILSDAYLANLREKTSVKKPKARISTQKQKSINHLSGLVNRARVAKKIVGIERIARKNYRYHHLFGDKNSKTLLIACGSMARALRAFEKEFQIFAPIRIWPILEEDLIKVAQGKRRIIVVEMNQGQYFGEVEKVLKRKIDFVGWEKETIDLKELRIKLKNLNQ